MSSSWWYVQEWLSSLLMAKKIGFQDDFDWGQRHASSWKIDYAASFINEFAGIAGCFMRAKAMKVGMFEWEPSPSQWIAQWANVVRKHFKLAKKWDGRANHAIMKATQKESVQKVISTRVPPFWLEDDMKKTLGRTTKETRTLYAWREQQILEPVCKRATK